jgi:hypothetical protein
LPARTSFTWSAVSVAVPVTGDVHGPQSGTTTGPAWPRAPAWMCAAVAGPDRCVNVNRHVSEVPLSVAVKRPEAPAFAPLTTPVSWPMFSAALSLYVVVADGLAAIATDAPISAAASVAMPSIMVLRMSFPPSAGLCKGDPRMRDFLRVNVVSVR